MKKSFITFILIVLTAGTLFAQQTIDDAIHSASMDMAKRCNSNTILAIDDFVSPSKEMTDYIRRHIVESLINDYRWLQIVTREQMDKIKK